MKFEQALGSSQILSMITNLLMTCGPTHLIPRSAFMESPINPNKWVMYYTTLKFPSSTNTHTHKITYLYILLYMSAQEHATSTTRGEKQKFCILHTSGCVMVDVPCLDYLWYGWKDCPDGRLGSTSGKYQETCPFACFWDLYGSLEMLGSPIGEFVGLSLL